MVGTKDVCMDGCGGETILEAFGAYEIVDAPAGVVLTCMESIRPPRIDILLVGMEMAECIDESFREEFGESATLFIRESGIAVVGLWVL